MPVSSTPITCLDSHDHQVLEKRGVASNRLLKQGRCTPVPASLSRAIGNSRRFGTASRQPQMPTVSVETTRQPALVSLALTDALLGSGRKVGHQRCAARPLRVGPTAYSTIHGSRRGSAASRSLAYTYTFDYSYARGCVSSAQWSLCARAAYDPISSLAMLYLASTTTLFMFRAHD